MELTDDYKNIVKLRFTNLSHLNDAFFSSFYNGLKDSSMFDEKSFEILSLAEILHYLKKSHSEYLTLWFPKIENIARDLQVELGVNDLTLSLQSFIVNYYNELSNHINFEEKVLYNFVEKLLKGIYVEKEKIFVLNHFLETHNHAVSDNLTTLKKMLLNKKPDLLDSEHAKNLFNHLTLVQNDLTLHGIIEDEILMDKIHEYIAENF